MNVKDKVKRTMAFLMMCGVLVTSSVPVLAANVGGGVWDYGTRIAGINRKTVYSNYYHPSKEHKSSCSIATTTVSSGWVNPGLTSYASATGTWGADTHAYYDYK